MNTYKKIIIGSILIGIILALLFYKDIKKDVIAITNNDDTIYLFQVGVYENIENANNKLKEYSGNIIMKINNYYHVISGICNNETTCNILKNYFNNLNIKYYIKKYKISNHFIKELNNYEIIINNTNNSIVIDSIINKINTLFLEYIP